MRENEKKELNLKGELFYFFLDLRQGGDQTVFKEQYAEYPAIADFADAASLRRYDEAVDRLSRQDSISESEREALMRMPYCYFNALIGWLSENDSVKIVLE